MIGNTSDEIINKFAQNLADDIDNQLLKKLMEDSMRAKLEFTLPEETDQLKVALRGIDYFSALWDIKNQIRNHNKYDVPAKEILDRIEELLYDVELNDIE